jgi:hypothetical protein
MTPSDDPFDPRLTEELRETDALLDRVGARAPTPDDLDDPLLAALALMAAEIDLEAVPVEVTRDAFDRAGRGAGLRSVDAPGLPPHDERTGLVIDLRDAAPQPPVAHDGMRRSRRRPDRPAAADRPAAMAPPRSLARMPSSTGPGGSRAPGGRRERRMRPLMAVAVAATALVLGSGVSAALTHGRSVNPLTGLQQVVAELTGGRTEEQAAALEDASRALDRAEDLAQKKQDDKARAELTKVRGLLPRLTDEDKAAVTRRLNEVSKRLR